MNTPPPKPPADDNDIEGWKAYNAERNRAERTISVEVLVHGGFTIREGDRHNIGLGWDEMLGHLAAMTMPTELKERGRIFPMTTDADDEERERRLTEMCHAREARPDPDFEISDTTKTPEEQSHE
jgi:hypothetical protein